MTKIKLCGLTRPCDIEAANALLPEYVGFVFAKSSRRYVAQATAAELKKMLNPVISAVGVFVDEQPEKIADMLNQGIIDVAQLHGREAEMDIRRLRSLTKRPIIKAFSVAGAQDIDIARHSTADYILLDSGNGGTGTAFDWSLLASIRRPYFLAGGLESSNVIDAVRTLSPYAVDVSSGIETNGVKDQEKMKEFVYTVRSVINGG